MLGLADELRSFPPVMFGVIDNEDDEDDEDGENDENDERENSNDRFAVPPESARLAAGALVYATDILVDELFEDVQILTQEEASVAECEGPLWHLERLPDRYALQYDARFARRFLVTVIAMTTRFTDGSFERLSCVAEELALRFLLSQATMTLELYELLDDDVSSALDALAGNVYEDMDHEWLYDASMDGIGEASGSAAFGVAPMALDSWFTPFDEGSCVHPSASDEPEPEAAVQ